MSPSHPSRWKSALTGVHDRWQWPPVLRRDPRDRSLYFFFLAFDGVEKLSPANSVIHEGSVAQTFPFTTLACPVGHENGATIGYATHK